MRHGNRREYVGHKAVSVADIWLAHPDRWQFLGGVMFDPSGRHETCEMGIKERDDRLARRADLRLIFEDPSLHAFLQQTKAIDVDPKELARWVLLARGEESVMKLT